MPIDEDDDLHNDDSKDGFGTCVAITLAGASVLAHDLDSAHRNWCAMRLLLQRHSK